MPNGPSIVLQSFLDDKKKYKEIKADAWDTVRVALNGKGAFEDAQNTQIQIILRNK